MYGMAGTIQATPGNGDQLAGLLREAATVVSALPSCRLYVVGRVDGSPDVVHVYEVWEDADAHAASLDLEEVQSIIGRARPIIAGTGERTELAVDGGPGLDG